jgi:predicted metal-dependent hydrolase
MIKESIMNIKVIKSKRKTIAIQINRDLSVTVRVPIFVKDSDIEQILKDKEDWIKENIESVKVQNEQCKNLQQKRLTKKDIEELADQALKIIPERVEHFAKQMGVDYGRITIRNQRTRWGSCSGNGNLNFNCLLMLAPSDVVDYVVVHELCHRKEMNHSESFWNEVEKVLPGYKEALKWLKDEGGRIMNMQR